MPMSTKSAAMASSHPQRNVTKEPAAAPIVPVSNCVSVGIIPFSKDCIVPSFPFKFILPAQPHRGFEWSAYRVTSLKQA